MATRQKLLITVAVVVVVGALAAIGTYGAFTATTSNSGNSISSGTVQVGQHSGATTLYNVSNQKPDQQTSACVRVTYTGSLPSSVKIYRTGGDNAWIWLYHLKIERGSGLTTLNNTMSCAGFTPSSTAFDNAFDGTPNSFATSTIDGKSGGAAWSNGQSVDYRFTVWPEDDPNPDSLHEDVHPSGAHTFVWEAQNN